MTCVRVALSLLVLVTDSVKAARLTSTAHGESDVEQPSAGRLAFSMPLWMTQNPAQPNGADSRPRPAPRPRPMPMPMPWKKPPVMTSPVNWPYRFRPPKQPEMTNQEFWEYLLPTSSVSEDSIKDSDGEGDTKSESAEIKYMHWQFALESSAQDRMPRLQLLQVQLEEFKSALHHQISSMDAEPLALQDPRALEDALAQFSQCDAQVTANQNAINELKEVQDEIAAAKADIRGHIVELAELKKGNVIFERSMLNLAEEVAIPPGVLAISPAGSAPAVQNIPADKRRNAFLDSFTEALRRLAKGPGDPLFEKAETIVPHLKASYTRMATVEKELEKSVLSLNTMQLELQLSVEDVVEQMVKSKDFIQRSFKLLEPNEAEWAGS